MISESRTKARISPIRIKPEMKIKTLSDPDVEKNHTVFVASFMGATNIFLERLFPKRTPRLNLKPKMGREYLRRHLKTLAVTISQGFRSIRN